MATVKFGTSGWRAIIGEDFTFRNVEIVAAAIAEVVKKETRTAPKLVIGYDGRFLSDAFARAAALTFADAGIIALLPKRPIPTPVVSHTIRSERLSGGIVMTASHNPPDYNGIKFSTSDGAPASNDLTARIAERANALMDEAGPEPRYPATYLEREALIDGYVKAGRIEWYEPYESYRDRLFDLVNADALRKARLTVAADVLYGAGRGFLPELLQEAGCEVQTLHAEANPHFGGRRPDPVGENIQELCELVRTSDAVAGLAVDGDADRFGIVDADGRYIHANHILGLALDYLVESRGWSGTVVRSVPTSHLIDAIADARGLDVIETGTGFKYIGEEFLKAPDRFILGGEESNGATIRGHIPEKDGIIVCLLIAEMIAATGKTVGESLSYLFRRVGDRVVDRLDLELTEARKTALLRRLKEDPPARIGDFAVEKVVTIDGYKFILDNGGFIAARASGTEPLVRCYLDAPSDRDMKAMRDAARKLVGG